MTTLGGGGTNPPPSSGGPDAPDGLRSDVYSKRSAELFWQREPAALALRYEIRRDGQVVGTTNGVSYYTNTLAAGTDYTFEVVAIGRDGSRSSPSRLTVRTTGDGSTRPPTGSGPAAPDGLRIELYSARSGELFWRRPDTFGLRYEVQRDGAAVATTDGVSYYEDTLSAGRRYVYEIITIGRDGRRSRASLVAVETVFLPISDAMCWHSPPPLVR